MKCICGYEYDKDYIDPSKTIGDKEFKLITLSGHKFTIASDNSWDDVDLGLYMCPKCQTIRGEEV